MSTIKITHTHPDGKVCYAIRAQRRFEDVGIVRLSSKEFVIAYMPYSGHWYAFNPQSGQEIGSFTREFYEEHLCPFRICDLLPDPTCVKTNV